MDKVEHRRGRAIELRKPSSGMCPNDRTTVYAATPRGRMQTAACIAVLLAWLLRAQAVTFYTNPTVLGSPSTEADFIAKESEGVRPVFLNRIVNTGSNPGKYTNSGAVKENAEGTSPFAVIFNFTNGKAFTATISWNLTGTGYQMQAYPKSAMLLQGAPLANGSIPYSLYNPSPSENLKSLGSFTARVNANADRNIIQVSFFGLPTSGSPPASSSTPTSKLRSSLRHQLCFTHRELLPLSATTWH